MKKSTSVAAAAVLVVLAGCGTTSPDAGSSPPTTASAPSRRIAPTIAVAPPPGPLVAAGRGWIASGLEGPVPAASSCGYGRAADGYPLPDRRCTPGAVDPSVTQADLGSTICRPGGYTATVRPPSRLTDAFKRRDEEAYQDPNPTSRTELDHLVPLELGGASDTRNLWPEPDQGSPAQFDPSDPFGSNAKDGVEGRLHDAVCSGQVDLTPAQAAIATDWTTALTALGVQP
jgi:hypothetical protein